MPFIKPERRQEIAEGKDCEAVGDICYIAYKHMVDLWNKEKRWTTYHYILEKVLYDPLIFFTDKERKQALAIHRTSDLVVAVRAAERIFLIRHVIDYEIEKEDENGGI